MSWLILLSVRGFFLYMYHLFFFSLSLFFCVLGVCVCVVCVCVCVCVCTYQASRTPCVLRSSSERLLKIPQVNLKSTCEHSFDFAVPSVIRFLVSSFDCWTGDNRFSAGKLVNGSQRGNGVLLYRSFSVSPSSFWDVGYVACPLSIRSSSAMSWNKESISSAWLIFRHLMPNDVSREVKLTFPCSVDKRLGVCHLMGLCISPTTRAFDAKYDHVTRFSKSIYLVSRVDCCWRLS